MTRTVYEVSPHAEGWQVKRRGASRAASTHSTKSDAIAAGRRVCKNNKPSQLVVKKRDGTIETEYTYDDDPYPPSG